jgi:hypothetical protein
LNIEAGRRLKLRDYNPTKEEPTSFMPAHGVPAEDGRRRRPPAGPALKW